LEKVLYYFDTRTTFFLIVIFLLSGLISKLKKVKLNDKHLKLQIWDTAGQERYRTIVSSFYRGANGILLVFDVTDPNTFLNCKHWLTEIKKNTTDNNVAIVLVGNKCDQEAKRNVDYNEANKFATSNGLTYMETSAKDSVRVEDAFKVLCENCISFAVGTTSEDEKKAEDINLKDAAETGPTVSKPPCGC